MQKGQHKGLEVAAKGLRLYPKDNLRAIKGVNFWPRSRLDMSINTQLRLVEVL